jgi:hypothetical protein
MATTLLAVLQTVDHLLACDNMYRPTRNFLARSPALAWRSTSPNFQQKD